MLSLCWSTQAATLLIFILSTLLGVMTVKYGGLCKQRTYIRPLTMKLLGFAWVAKRQQNKMLLPANVFDSTHDH